MRLLILTAIIVVLAETQGGVTNPVIQGKTWPWKVGKIYQYEAQSHTWVDYKKGDRIGNTIKMDLLLSVKAEGHLQVEVKNPQYIYGQSSDKNVEPKPIQNMNQTIDILVVGGRVGSISFPSSVSVVHENIIKGFISALQVDLSSLDVVQDFPNSYDEKSFQGLFKKMEYDLYGQCETLYSVSPVSAEWRRELPKFASEDVIEILKTKNYGSCTKRVAATFGVPEGAVWNTIAKGHDEKQFIKHNSMTRMIVGKQGTVFKSETTTSVKVSPLVYGKEKAEVSSIVTVELQSVEQSNSAEWQKCKDCRTLNSLLFRLDDSWRLFSYGDNQNVARAQQVLQEITPWLQDPNHLAKGNFLTRFSVLVYIVAAMNSQQLAQMTNSIEIAKTSKNIAKNYMWTVYRDAVAESGSRRAYEEIKSWIMTKKVEGEEAAQVVSAIGASLYNPSKAVLVDFFNFAMCPEVLGQKSLNNSALLTVSKLLRSNKDDQFIMDTVIPRFSKELQDALNSGETSKAQVYIIVLGNLAHPGILKAFAPYLEGQVTVTKYLRTQMVTSLKTLANKRDKYVRAVLFSILKNTGEPYEVRVAAALNIFLAFPTPEMMQVMAVMSNHDPSTQVRAVLTTSITFAAGLKDPRFAELAKTAQSVLNVISKEKYGYSYSTDSLIDGYTSDDDFSFFREISFIGSENSLFPKYHRSALRFRGTAFNDEEQVTFSISDMPNLVDMIAHAIHGPNDFNPKLKFSAKQILDMLKIKRNPRQPLELSFFVEFLNQQKLITANEREITLFIENILQKMAVDGFGTNFAKIWRHNQIFVDFPLPNGMPFTYQYSEPMIINMQAETKILFDDKPIRSGYIQLEFNMTYGRTIAGSASFMDTIGEVLVGAGAINKFQVYIPGKIKTTMAFTGESEIEIKPLQVDKDITLLHRSVLPFTGTHKRNSVTYDLNIIKGSEENRLTSDIKFGHQLGLHFYFHGETYSTDLGYSENDYGDDLLTNIGIFLNSKNIAFMEYDFKCLAPAINPVNWTTTISWYFDKRYNENNGGEMGPATLTEHTEPNSIIRRQELIKKVSTGIKAAEVKIVDFSIVFDGLFKQHLVFTGAYADSFVDPKAQGAYILYIDGAEQISTVLKLNNEDAKIVPLNFEEALKNKFVISYETDVKIGPNVTVHTQGKGERTNKYTELLKNDVTGKSCLQDVKYGNLYQKNCHKMIIKAHAPDHYEAKITYTGSEIEFWPWVNSINETLKEQYFKDVRILPSPMRTLADTISMEANYDYLNNLESYKIMSKNGGMLIHNVEGSWYDVYVSAIYAPITAWERIRNFYTDYQYMPYCAIDDSKVRTFSGRSYNYKLTSSWHVVMVDRADDRQKYDDLVILARRPSDKEEMVYLSYKSQTAHYVELEISPNKVDVKSDVNKTCEGDLTMYWDEEAVEPLLEYYTLAEGVQVFNIRNRHLRLMYDRQRLIIFSDDHRSTTKGICGQSTGQIGDDYMTPWGLVDLPDQYGAAFSLEDENSDPKTVQSKKDALLMAYQPETKFTKISDAAWSNMIN